MSKINLQTVTNFQDDVSAVATFNNNMQILQNVIDSLLSRDGKTPNQLETDIDFNGKRVLNLPIPLSRNEPALAGQVSDLVVQASNGSFPDGGIGEPKYGLASVSERALANGAVTNTKIGTGAVDSSKIADGSIQGSDIAFATITTDKIEQFAPRTIMGNLSYGNNIPYQIPLNDLTNAIFSGGTNYIPPGAVIPFASSRMPLGFLICDGTYVSRAAFPALFNYLCPASNVTFVVGDNAVYWSGHQLQYCDGVAFFTQGILPNGIAFGVPYFVRDINPGVSFRVSAYPGGPVVGMSGAPTGVHVGQATGFGLGGNYDFKLPDLRGEFIRGSDWYRGLDPNRTIGGFQDSAVGPHNHAYTNTVAKGIVGAAQPGSTGITQYGGNDDFNATTSDVQPYTNETRPRNINLLYGIKY